MLVTTWRAKRLVHVILTPFIRHRTARLHWVRFRPMNDDNITRIAVASRRRCQSFDHDGAGGGATVAGRSS